MAEVPADDLGLLLVAAAEAETPQVGSSMIVLPISQRLAYLERP